MKGTTHLTIGLAIGAAAAASHAFTVKHAALYVAVAAFSSLSADLDGTNMLSGKLNRTARTIHALLLWGGAALTVAIGVQYAAQGVLHMEWAIAAVAVLLLGLVLGNGMIRNALVSAIGAALLYGGLNGEMNWLIGLGVFVAWVPWLNHRGLSHTIWAAGAWWAIGWGLEQQIGVDGIAQVALWGYLSHLIADTLTPSGVKWLYPLTKKTFKLPIGKL
ncbi:metal-dependent hydrolase [Paenibacillus sacheonensis]|uniref:Metal-dependent hydrolase n=1 Tax=Paenibacillus sacheonensis TaxID=742054 RepID=A0A7X4YNU6_9BACL|nr:metal-dependent hydrolase [Paenibacillus sacheonensis]MBM7565325.1 inner membrane protein [Paenibacillus sacheonensis]NBC69743.1 metal-dependent hydrolase [Paenibacillus sacheonensis]